MLNYLNLIGNLYLQVFCFMLSGKYKTPLEVEALSNARKTKCSPRTGCS